MKILHCLHNYHPARGGAEILMKEVSERLVRRGHEVQVLCTNARSTEDYFLPGKGRDLLPAGTEVIGGVSVTRVPFHRFGAAGLNLLRAAACRVPFPTGEYWRTLSWGPRSRAYRKAASGASEACLLVGCPLPTLNVRMARNEARQSGRPFVLVPCFHTEDRWTFHLETYFGWLREASRVVCLTSLEKELFRNAAKVPDERLVVGGVGIEPGPDGPAEIAARKPALRREILADDSLADCDMVLFLGQHARHKGILDLIKAMPAVWRERPRTVFVLAGNPTALTPEIRRRIAHLPVAERKKVRLIEGLSEEAKQRLLEAADVFASVSPFESFGIVFLEAWRAGLPVVGCRRGASSRVIEEFRDGLLVRDEKPAELAGALLALLADPGMRRRMGEAGFKKTRDVYSWDRVMPVWEKAYEDAVHRR